MYQSAEPALKVQQVTINQQPLFLRLFAGLISIIFHPLFIPVYFTCYLAYINPGYFIGFDGHLKGLIVVRVAINMVFFPLLTVLLLKGVGFINSIFLKTQRERTIPYITCGIFFFWMYLVFRNQPEIPIVLTAFIFSVFISSSVALLANIYFKISMHAIGVGGLVGVMFIIALTNTTFPVTLPLMISIFIAGLVCTARLIVSDHAQGDIYAGLLCGFICQLFGAYFIQ